VQSHSSRAQCCMANVGVLAGTVTRTWTVAAGGMAVRVELNHNTVTGWHALALDGIDVPGTEGSCHALSSAKDLVFESSGRRGVVTIAPSFGSFHYECRFDGMLIVEDNERPSGSAFAESDAASLEISVLSPVVALDEAGKRVVYYLIRSRRRGDARTNAVHRRFRDILSAFDAVQASYKGTQLAASLPVAPSRSWSLFVDHFAPEFIEERRASLERFLVSLASVPRVKSNGDFQGILGLSSTLVRETSVLFASGPLGLVLEDRDSQSVVKGFSSAPEGGPGQAERSGRIGVGDIVSKLNGEDVLGIPHDVLMAKLRTAGRPLMVHFIGYFSGEETTSTPAASSRPAKSYASAVKTSGFDDEEEEDPFKGRSTWAAEAPVSAVASSARNGGLFGAEATDDDAFEDVALS
jgi:hypothetical protein